MDVNPLTFSDGLILDGDQNHIVIVYDHGQLTEYALENPRWMKYLADMGLWDAASINGPDLHNVSASDVPTSVEGQGQDEGEVATSSSRKRKECEPGLEEN